MTLEREAKVLLIGGTSHVGKSTLARQLAAQIGCAEWSTDALARHPGRPWGRDGAPVPEHVREHYSNNRSTVLVSAVWQHFEQNVGPIVRAIVRSHINNPFDPKLVLEGSAILPHLVAELQDPGVQLAWISLPADVITRRIHNESAYALASTADKGLIEAFIERTLQFDQDLCTACTALGLPVMTADEPQTFKTLEALL